MRPTRRRPSPQHSAQFEALVASVEHPLAGFGVGPAPVRAATQSFDIGSVLGFVGGLLSSLTGVLPNVVLVLALMLYFIADASGFGRGLHVVAADRPHVAWALEGSAHRHRRYLVVTTVFGLIVAVVDGVAPAVLGVPLAVCRRFLRSQSREPREVTGRPRAGTSASRGDDLPPR